MGIDAWIAICVTLIVFIAFVTRRSVPSDVLFLGGLVTVTLLGVITPEQALKGFSNQAVLTIAGLLVVAAGLRSTGVLDWVGQKLLGNVNTEGAAIRRLTVTLIATSAFVLNTALVAMMLPVVVDWCRKKKVSPTRMLIPLSYLTILGGVCTLIGTSTLLVANGMLRTQFEQRMSDPRLGEQRINDVDVAGVELTTEQRFALATAPMELFEIGKLGLPCALAGAAVILLFGKYLLPRRTAPLDRLGEQRREYLVEMLVQPGCRLGGQTVEQAGLRQLDGLFLIEIDRGSELLTPVTPEDTIHENDRLIFTGVVSTIVELEQIPGLVPAADMTFEFHPSKRQQRHLTEAVLSRTSPIIGATVREANFRQRYNAAVVAVHRNGIRLTNKIGDIRLEPGDTLLLQTRSEFVPNYRNSRDFYLVSSVDGDAPRRHDRAWLAACLAGLLIAWLTVSTLPAMQTLWPGASSTAVAAIAVACLMVLTRGIRTSQARNAIDMHMLLTIVGAIGLGEALTVSQAARFMADSLVGIFGDHPYLLLVVIYLLAMLFTELITNTAVAATLIPVAINVAEVGQYNPRPFIVAVATAASLSFITPIGYQTNLMVMGPGGYRPTDYFWIGIPVAGTVAATAMVLIPYIWPFQL
jgi:di/tricarboxylate transporter